MDTSLYDRDFYRWLEVTTAQLRAQQFQQVDWENLLEEIESLGRSEKNALASHLMWLCEHLLKIQYWESERANCLRGWKVEVFEFRRQIQEALATSPSLRPFLQSIFVKQYQNGRKRFLLASDLAAAGIPPVPEFSLEQALDPDWLPAQPGDDSKNPTINPAMVENATEAPPNS